MLTFIGYPEQNYRISLVTILSEKLKKKNSVFHFEIIPCFVLKDIYIMLNLDKRFQSNRHKCPYKTQIILSLIVLK